jgi:hypothetical protein
MGTDRQTDRPTDRHRSEYNSPSLIPFITIVIIKEGRTKKEGRNKVTKRDGKE